jgi:hypothetical protein
MRIMAERLYYATHNVSGFKEGAVTIMDEQHPLAQSGYFKEIKEPERVDAVQGEDRP